MASTERGKAGHWHLAWPVDEKAGTRLTPLVASTERGKARHWQLLWPLDGKTKFCITQLVAITERSKAGRTLAISLAAGWEN